MNARLSCIQVDLVHSDGAFVNDAPKPTADEDAASASAYALSSMPLVLPIPPSEQTIGLIVIPASRSADNLEFGINLAKEAGVALVVLASHGLQATVAETSITKAGVQGFVVCLPDDYVPPLTSDFATYKHRHTAGRTSNLSGKRNLGLLLSYLTKKHVFFLDDDIRGITEEKLALVGSGLHKYAVSGFFISYFPDSAVTRHAYRLGGGNQAPDLTGNSLAVNTNRITSFFPNIYNEDLLFVYDAMVAKSTTALSWAEQLPYSPFIPERAISEEFGCIVAVEGLLSLLAQGKTFLDADAAYWAVVLQRRKLFLQNITRSLKAKGSTDIPIEPALQAVHAAEGQLARFKPDDFTSYIKDWRADVILWRERLYSLPRGLSLEKAMELLDLS